MHLVAVGIIILSSLLRLVGVCRPLIGNFSQYQTGQAMIAHFFILERWQGWLYPKIYALSNAKPGLVLLYYPVAAATAALFQKTFGGDVGMWGRFQSVFFFGLASWFLFLLIRTLWNHRMAVISLIVFSLFPLTFIYGQSFQNEMAAVFFSVSFFYYYVLAVKRGSFFCSIAAGTLFSGILLTRPNSLYLILPAVAVLFSKDLTGGRSRRTLFFQVSMLFSAAIVAPALWYRHIWLLSQTETHIFGTMFYQLSSRKSFLSFLVLNPNYYKTIYDLMAGRVFTPIGFTLLILGLFLGRSELQKSFLFYFWLFAAFSAVLLTPRKFVDHDFYWLHMLPPAALFIALAFDALMKALEAHKKSLRTFAALFLVVATVVSLRYSLHPAFHSSPMDVTLLKMAGKVKSFTKPSDDRIIVQDTYNLLYYADRLGWVLPLAELMPLSPYFHENYGRNLAVVEYENLRTTFSRPVSLLQHLVQKEGATYLVVTDLKEFNDVVSFSSYVSKNYVKVYSDPEIGMIFKLTGREPVPNN